jgi:P27 family predicted phage terminase small subunit
VGNKLLKLGLVTELDETMFALYCQTYSTWLQLSRDVKKEGVFIAVPVMVDGEPLVIDGKAVTAQEKNPKQIELRLLTTQLKNIAAEFGMSPSSRARLSVDLPEGEEDEMKGWIEGKRANG